MLSRHKINVQWQNQNHPVWVVKNFDSFLDDFAVEVEGQLNDERCPFGVLLWPSSRSLAHFLNEFPKPHAVRRIIELGCGVGFLSCVLAKLFPDAEIIACDYEEHLEEFVDLNAKEWGVSDRLSFRKIDWRGKAPQELLHSADAVFGADVFYDDSHIRYLPQFANQLLKDKGLFMLADPKRYRFGKALEELESYFHLKMHHEHACQLVEEGIEEFMVGSGYKEQKISILELYKGRAAKIQA